MTQTQIPDFSRSSFPYLAVARFYEVPYADVLRLAEKLDEVACGDCHDPASYVVKQWIGPWRTAVLRAWQVERQRRMFA